MQDNEVVRWFGCAVPDSALQAQFRPETFIERVRRMPRLLEERTPLAGETVLHYLAVDGHAEGVIRAIQMGAGVNVRSRHGSTPLVDAARLGHEAVVGALLAAGADPNVTDGDGMSPLHWAALMGHLGLASRLLEAGADPWVANQVGQQSWELADPDDVRGGFAQLVCANCSRQRAA